MNYTYTYAAIGILYALWSLSWLSIDAFADIVKTDDDLSEQMSRSPDWLNQTAMIACWLAWICLCSAFWPVVAAWELYEKLRND